MTGLPNLLTLSRILVIPFIIALIWLNEPMYRWIALGLYAFAGITDYLDGYLARSMNQQSDFGRLLDPIADKLLVGACLLILCALDHISGYSLLPALIILLREILVSGLREFLAEIQVRMPVSKLAKWKTAFQIGSLGFLIVGSAGPAWLPTVLIGEGLLWAAAILTLVTGYDYLRSGLLHVTPEAQAERARRRSSSGKGAAADA
ncbi:CDP-diacylglycerol--glycerol-3-phosphate 3-phosphatidyltransferase [Nisaea acidiphila]|uniref:CDP-diacylglycerol--glycerol-3-phosphate 3-phosphatidyltransferase n=1 Tax=Nisaea acidiphila TaxID=1862145 RepID=A0A9J7AQE7_9PROT|nr:CDP-diacylglycerol--glycerol-3-phosphate 3-phosphatidyltransferase [Nisaea acidiphila]UUX49114.1 CDP-diacylglycerol--glycerol-3-phosphate 3-phosphatidyltransferase [Nisaea acidiphila]